MKILVLILFLFSFNKSSACGPNYCRKPWDDLIKNVPQSESLTFDELMLGNLTADTILKAYFPEYSSKTNEDGYFKIDLIERKKQLEPIFNKYKIKTSELNPNYLKTNLKLYFRIPSSFIQLVEGAESAGLPEALIKKLIIARDNLEINKIIEKYARQNKSASIPIEKIGSEPIPPEFRDWFKYADVASTYAALDSWESLMPNDSFLDLLKSSVPWIRERSLFTLMNLDIHRLLNDSENTDDIDYENNPTFKSLMAYIVQFKKEFPAGTLINSVEQMDLFVLSFTNKNHECRERLGNLIEKYFANRDLNSLKALNIDTSMHICSSSSNFWQYPIISSITEVNSKITNAEFVKNWAELVSFETHYEKVPALLLYQKAKLYFAAKNFSPLFTLPIPSEPRIIANAIRILRYRAFLENKQYLLAEKEAKEIIKQRSQNGGAAQLLLAKAQIKGNLIKNLIQEPTYSNDFLQIIAQEHLNKEQLDTIVEKLSDLKITQQESITPILINKFLAKKQFAQIERLAKIKVQSPQLSNKIQTLSHLNKNPNVESYFLAGDFLRLNLAEKPELTSECFSESLPINVETPSAEISSSGDVRAFSSSFEYYQMAYNKLKSETNKEIITTWEPKILHRMLSCFRSSNLWYTCWTYSPASVQESISRNERKEWFQNLKTKYSNTPEAKSLSLYW